MLTVPPEIDRLQSGFSSSGYSLSRKPDIATKARKARKRTVRTGLFRVFVFSCFRGRSLHCRDRHFIGSWRETSGPRPSCCRGAPAASALLCESERSGIIRAPTRSEKAKVHVPLANGTRVGPYEIVSPLGAGGMGEVYRARDARLGREVALKLLPAIFASDPDRHRRFQQEAQAIGRLNHPNLL